ncbi:MULTISPECIES: DUF3806 domain-containing protein [unclassified Bradyrhizobium]
MEQKIEPLSEADAAHVEKQRSWVRDHYAPETRDQYETLEGKLTLLETIIKEKWIEPHETWKLQCLGITFGDALAQEMGLSWTAVEDQYGRDPALHEPGTTILVFPLTTISKRIERGETVSVRDLFAKACDYRERQSQDSVGRNALIAIVQWPAASSAMIAPASLTA